MKMNRLLLLFPLLSLMASCTLYEDGPLLSVIPKADRIAGTWKVEQAFNGSGDDVTNVYESYTWVFDRDGGATATWTESGISFSLDGTWSLLDDDAVFQLVLNGSILGIPFTDVAEYDILRLSNDEFWLLDEDGNEIRLALQ